MRRESRPNWSKFKNYPFVLRSLEGAKRGETRFTQTGTANKTPCLGVTLWEETTSEMQNIAPIQNPERIRAASIIPHKSSLLASAQRRRQNIAQGILVERLLNHEIDPALCDLLVAELAAPAGNQHRWHTRVAPLDLAQQIPSVHIGHTQVGYHQVERVGRERLERLSAIRRLRNLMAPARQQAHGRIAD